MSFIRALERGRFTSIKGGLYSYPHEEDIDISGSRSIKKDDFVEIMFRILEQSGVKFDLKDVNNVRKRLYMRPIKRIKSDEESSKAYFPKRSQKTGKKK